MAEKPALPPADTIAACNRWLQTVRASSFDKGLAMSAQADAFSRVGDEVEATRLRRAAVGAYGHSLSGYPSDSAAHWNSGVLMRQLGDFEQAREAFLAHTQLESDRGDGWFELGMVEVELRRFPDAIAHLTRAIERLPGEARPLAGRGIAYRLAGDCARADLDFDEARRRDPADPLLKVADEMFPPVVESPASAKPGLVVDDG
ncbi:tetratricopeptide repeat protein [Sphingomonas glaciei]|uniref:Tetratricopeptide repeat protein n=1 Tax=Sphingomonas glaciei TaxID=2938948 RepID=A0ABY5MXV1_9SPHN|nr:tetratricopeptide repeat protein [Sphingomonas glaciei]UUR09267.1 tetratricopeptide repeat protein [Sphingomonas glaciei]